MGDPMAKPTALADDLLTGAAAIAEYLGWNQRRIYHAASQGYLPIGRAGQLLIARKSELNRALSPATQNACELVPSASTAIQCKGTRFHSDHDDVARRAERETTKMAR